MASFSSRTGWDMDESDLTRAVEARRRRGEPLLDLTVSNPTACGIGYDATALLGALNDARSLVYDPDPRGLPAARGAVAGYYAGHGAVVSTDQIVLTTGTSEAYSFLFRLLCDPGDEVMTALPGYPLFDFLATLDDVVLTTYPLFHDFGWWIDLAELERQIRPSTRALVLVHPNNPTGHATGRGERRQVEELCVRHGLALIVDEVFLDYPVEIDAGGLTSFAQGPHACLTLVVSGISKICALPQMKVGWIAVFGPEGERREALNRLEVIADTFLSLNAPVQHALGRWLDGRAATIGQIAARVRQNLDAVAAASTWGLEHLPVEAGWSAVLRLPGALLGAGKAGVAEFLVERAGVLVHPGSFYGLAGRNTVVISLLVPPEEMGNAIEELKILAAKMG